MSTNKKKDQDIEKQNKTASKRVAKSDKASEQIKLDAKFVEDLPVVFAPVETLYETLYVTETKEFSSKALDDVLIKTYGIETFTSEKASLLKNFLLVPSDEKYIPKDLAEVAQRPSSFATNLGNYGFICQVEGLKAEGVTGQLSLVVKVLAEGTFQFANLTYKKEAEASKKEVSGLFAPVKLSEFELNSSNARDFNEDDQVVSERTQAFAVTKLKQTVFSFSRINNYDSTEIERLINLEYPYEQYVYTVLTSLRLSSRVTNAFAKEPTLYYRYIFLISHLEFLLKRDAFDLELQDNVRKNMETAQRKYYVREQIRALKKELNSEAEESDTDKFTQKLDNLKIEDTLPDLYAKIRNEIQRLEIIPSNSQEYYMQQNYVEWLLKTPYKGEELKSIDLKKSREILDQDHFGLADVKERILEYLAVLSRVDVAKSPVLCLIGPPGVGKTSLGKSIAEATGRKYTRWALGGISDEAEIRGHRRTYIGSQPGKVISHLSKVGVNNPLFLLDEIDKLTSNHRGDPAAALLEVLDPEQNNKFVDNYLEIDYDLSKVLFIATANSYNIPPALLDRMEIIDLGSYTRDEKFQIAKTHILGKLYRRNAIKDGEIEFPDAMINLIIDGYTNEPGVRSLERRIERVIRYSIKQIVEQGDSVIKVDQELIQKVLGPVVNESNVEQVEFRSKSFVGQITGLAWTQSGGDVLPIEAATPVGKGEISATGSLGNQIKESIRAAITVIRQRYKQFDLEPDFYSKFDFHVHFPNAGINKDGPSAGSAITTCLISSLTGKPIAMDIGMTGEISLHGDVLRIGGVKEKVISAHRNGVKHIILPKSNEPDLYKVPQSIKDELQFYPVETIDEVIDIVFGDKKRPAKKSQAELDLEAVVSNKTKTTKAKKTVKATQVAEDETVEAKSKKSKATKAKVEKVEDEASKKKTTRRKKSSN
ncbi:endopeptidase La [Psittacicella hinzii]|uniref:endopeptidase La n=1 Tax=Psittacicella hinzii TaxID=2028575 RepID=A0A3A1Y388_9GAMM|nr:endopeptidase La [Psittacicella hinzii]RIY31706.1 endopeptidase La [Psittacicella hinzii]